MNFEQLYQKHYRQIYAFCYRSIDQREKVGDLTQETFLRLYNRMKKSNPPIENPRAWLYKVAGNLCLNELNVSRRRTEIIQELPLEKTDRNNPETLLVEEERFQLLQKVLQDLKPEHRLLVMMYQDGLSYREMAEATGIPENSIGKTLWRSIDKIAQIIKTKDYVYGRDSA
jgi:RNA polymerase sigma factor (sigma-70 family)